MPYRLNPETYPCPTHPHVDLTPEVEREACAGPTVVIADQLTGPSLQLDLGDAAASVRRGPFQVGVDCPGSTPDGTGKAEPHRVYLSGEVQ